MSDLLFAYGFLKRAYHGNQDTKTPAMDVEFVAEGLLQGKIYRVSRYPGVVFDAMEEYSVKGEIFRLRNPELLFPILDRYEHSAPLVTEDPEYHRRLRTIKTSQGMMDCWVYEYLKPLSDDKRILSGEF